MPPRATILTIPKREWAHVIKECGLGMVRERRKIGLPLDEEKAKCYFEERTKRSDYHDFTDSRREWYSDIIRVSSEIKGLIHSNDSLSILDLGCGTGGIRNALVKLLGPNKRLNYLGVEQDRILVEKCRKQFGHEHEFVRGDICRLHQLNLDVTFRDPDIIFASNVFPYVNAPVPILAYCLHNIAVSGKTKLALIEPNPCLYWESEFGGFGIKLRSEAQWLDLAYKAGWCQHLETVQLYLCNVFGWTFLKMANLLIFK